KDSSRIDFIDAPRSWLSDTNVFSPIAAKNVPRGRKSRWFRALRVWDRTSKSGVRKIARQIQGFSATPCNAHARWSAPPRFGRCESEKRTQSGGCREDVPRWSAETLDAVKARRCSPLLAFQPIS